MYKISPSTLKMGMASNRFSCLRCFWYKVVHRVRPPEMAGLGKLHHQIHDWIYAYLAHGWLDCLPKGKIIRTEMEVHGEPNRGIELWGYLDALIELRSGGYVILDIKTTNATEWVTKNYMLQLNTYAYCLENDIGSSAFSPIRGLGILTFSGQRFGRNTDDQAGIVGVCAWHEIPMRPDIVTQAIDEVLPILKSEDAPASNPDCENCRFVGQRLSARPMTSSDGITTLL